MNDRRVVYLENKRQEEALANEQSGTLNARNADYVGLSSAPLYASKTIYGNLTCESIHLSDTLESSVLTGTPPFVVESNTLVPNLAVARAQFAANAPHPVPYTGVISSTGLVTSITSKTGTGSTFVTQQSPSIASATLGNATGTSLTASGQITSTLATGTPPFVVSSSTTVANLKASTTALNSDMTGPVVITGNTTSVSQTGTGSTFAMQNTPTFITPSIGAATGTSLSLSGQLTTSISTGTPPFVVASTTPVSNLQLATTTPSSLSAGTTSSEGTSLLYSRSDHTHVVPTASAVTISGSTSNSEGVSSSLARSDHTHQVTGVSGTPAGANTQFQYNNSGAFGGVAMTYDGTNVAITSTTDSTASSNGSITIAGGLGIGGNLSANQPTLFVVANTSATQSVPTSTWTELAGLWSSASTPVTRGTGLSFSTSTGRVTVTQSGYYYCGAYVNIPVTSGGERSLSLAINGAFNGIGLNTGTITSTAPQMIQTVSKILYLNAGDYVSVFTFQASGASRTYTVNNPSVTTFQIALLF